MDLFFFFPFTIEGYYVLTLKSDMKSTYLPSQPDLCYVNTIIQNYRVGMKVGRRSRQKKQNVSSFIRHCLSSFNLHSVFVSSGFGRPRSDGCDGWPAASKLLFIFRNQ